MFQFDSQALLMSAICFSSAEEHAAQAPVEETNTQKAIKATQRRMMNLLNISDQPARRPIVRRAQDEWQIP
jgi:hypothetical protein